ncbi:MAG: pirin family protein [Myxococcales bacterium]|jgi:redox-sensitive bicupin YhaK (pirin superfamily)
MALGPMNELEDAMDIRPASDRGHVDFGWLRSAHSFSFGHYYRPDRMGFGVLRVINDDRVAPDGGFPTHPHRDMEIVSYVVDGALEHRDTLGNGSVIRPGEVQRMSAGRGIAHSEYNHDVDREVRFLQIWILPAERGTDPGYEQRDFSLDPEQPLRLVVSPDGRDGSVRIHQDVRILRAHFARDGQRASLALPDGRSAWVQVVHGPVSLGERALSEGDGVALPQGGTLELSGDAGAEALVFDLPEVNRD